MSREPCVGIGDAPGASGASPTGLSSDATVLIVEEYVPEYRQRFFELLEAALGRQSIRLIVAVGSTPSPLEARGDSAADAPLVRSVPARTVSVAGRHLTYRRLSSFASNADLVIVGQGLRHLENYRLLLWPGRSKVAFWDHGGRLVKEATLLERLVQRLLLRSAHWYFAYTSRGAEQLVGAGFPRERLTVVQNTFDVGELARMRDHVDGVDRRRVREELSLPERHVCIYIGALDPSKRLDFLLEAGSIVARRVPDFTLVVAGDGPDRPTVERALESRPWLRYVGRAVGGTKAELGSTADLLLMPGSVGLVAVDSFALQTPIVTTRWPFHGPEMDYLVDGVNALVSDDDVGEFARTIESVLLDRAELARLKAACGEAALRYSLEHMVSNYAEGIAAALAAPRR